MIFRWLNNNMRCFEISKDEVKMEVADKLNNNMRCFEIALRLRPLHYPQPLNNNMRCFEISSSEFYYHVVCC